MNISSTNMDSAETQLEMTDSVIAQGLGSSDDSLLQGLRISFNPSKRKTVKKISVLIEGTFSIRNSMEAYQRMQKETEAFDVIDCSLKHLEQFDLSAVQMLQYFKKVQTAQGKTVSLDSELNGEDRSLMLNAGLIEYISKAKLTDKN